MGSDEEQCNEGYRMIYPSWQRLPLRWVQKIAASLWCYQILAEKSLLSVIKKEEMKNYLINHLLGQIVESSSGRWVPLEDLVAHRGNHVRFQATAGLTSQFVV